MQWKFLGRTFYLSKALVVFLAGVVCIALISGGYLLSDWITDSKDSVTYVGTATSPGPVVTTESLALTASPQKVLWEIYIVGAVENPGIYTLEEGALVHDAIEAAGGLLQSADPAKVNMVQALQDNLMIQILTEEERLEQERGSSLVLLKDNAELGGGQTSQGTHGDTEGKININSATKEELMTLSGIGQARAESIIAYREEHGPFQTIEDIMLVSGIKESAFAKIKDRITT